MTISVIFDVLNKATQPLGGIKKMFSEVGGTIDRVSDRMMKLNQTVEMVDKIGAAAERITQPYREFEQSMAELSSITGIVGDDLDQLGKVARKSGVDSGLGAKGAVDAFALLASQIQVSDIGMEGLITLQERTITLAQASGMTMEESATALAGTINQFGLQATESKRVIDVLAAGAKYGAASIPELSQSFKVVGAAANAAGLSVESTAGALEVLSKNNLKGAEAGTALRNIMLKMQTALNVDFNKTSLSEALTKLRPKMKDANYMAKIFGMENMAAAQFMIANADAVDKLTTQVTGTDVAQEQASINTDTWNHRLEVQAARLNEWGMKLAENGKGILNVIQVGSQFSSMFLAFTPLISFAGGALGGLYSITKNVIKGMLGTATSGKAAAVGLRLKNAAVATGNGILAVYNALTSRAWWTAMAHAVATKASALWTAVCSKAQLVASVITSLWTKRTALATLVQGGLTKALRIAKITMLTGVIPALTGVIASTWAWTVALLANPITWIVLAVIALITAVVMCWQKFEGFRAVIYTIWDTIKGFGQALWDYVCAPFEAIWGFVKSIGSAIGTLFGGGSLEEAGDAFSKGVDNTRTNYANRIESGNQHMGQAVSFSDNYDRHLAEEKAKTAAKEKAKQTRAASPMDSGMGIDMKGLETQLGGMPVGDIDLAGMETQLGAEFANPAEITGYAAPQQTPPTLSRGGLLATAGELQNGNNRAQSSAAAAAHGAMITTSVQVDFKPTINISGDMSKKSKDDLLALFRQYAADLAKMVNEENRKQNRGNYGVPAIG